MNAEYENYFNLGKIVAAEKKLRKALNFSIKYKIPNGKLMAISKLRDFYFKTDQILKLKKLKKDWDSINIELLTECEKTSKKEPNLPKLISEENKIKYLITSRCPHLKFDTILKNCEPEILKYRKYSMAQVYIGEGIRQFNKKNYDKADSLYNLANNEISKYEYDLKPYLELLYEKGNVSVNNFNNNLRKSIFTTFDPLLPYLLDDALTNYENARSIYSDFELETTNANIVVLKEIAYISSLKNPRISKQYYESALDIFNNSEWKNSYLHSQVLLEYFDMINNNYNTINKKEFALELLKKCEKIRKKLLGSNDPKTERVVELKKSLSKEIKSKQR